MFRLIASVSDRLIAALCVALMMFYAATMPAKAADQIQHAPALMVAHDHDGLDRFSIDAVHDSHDEPAAHHDDTPDTGDQPDDHLGGGHHHHGDNGPNLLVPNVVATPGIALSRSLHGARIERPIAGLRSVGPERPPRTISLTV